MFIGYIVILLVKVNYMMIIKAHQVTSKSHIVKVCTTKQPHRMGFAFELSLANAYRTTVSFLASSCSDS